MASGQPHSTGAGARPPPWQALLPALLPLPVVIALKLLWPFLGAELGLATEKPTFITLDHLFSALIFFAFAFLVNRLMGVFVWHGLLARRGATAPMRLLANLVDIATWLFTIGLINFFVLGHAVGTLLTGSGVLVALVAFAMKGLIADTFSGIALALERPFRFGDWVDVGQGVVGRVSSMTWRATTLDLLNGSHYVIPNSRLSELSVRVYGEWRDSVELEFAYDIDPERLRRVLCGAAEGMEEWPGHMPPVARAFDFNGDSVKWRLIYSVPDFPSRFRLRDEVISKIAEALRAEGLAPAAIMPVAEKG
jgi:small-conductance mechanosensitive channel